MKIKGATEAEINTVLKILAPYFMEYDFYFYGSRVRGDFRTLSDLDIQIKGKTSMPLEVIDSLKEAFDNSTLPYIVNLTDFYNISDEFYKMIQDDCISAKSLI